MALERKLERDPALKENVPRVICRFRERPVAFGGDIQEMYHQIRTRSEDKQAQRFLFRSNSVETPQVYVMDVATFGSTCSPCSAQYVKNLNSEQFSAFQSVLDGDERPTKRIVLSFVMAQFDPTGLITPMTVHGKMLIQDLWRTGCDWDTKIDAEMLDKWRRLIGMMRNIKSFRISRSYFRDAKSTEIQELELLIIADASEKAYGCVAYFRAVGGGEVRCVLVMSRSKVAPLKQVSIPHLELLTAVFAARLSRTVIENHCPVVGRVVFWIDASEVLSWMRSDQRRYEQFVGFRIGEILSLTKLTDWCWVPTRMNAADQLTKWGKDPEMHPGSAWIRGLSFLYENEKWPKKELPPSNTTGELRIHLLLHNVKVQTILIDAGRISRWTVLVRTMACVFRFI
ncbi:uncharacterized protein LOC129728591 [Wyeomyia smithii]|uniref:uncharacterized protein LOC129728591 n=1 Tax=Wyeomyia smithii TaxID=174621 RepID=UPI002467F191|nr:uncharacterized protein LOC129728591 [Wyeomyia smithii]